MKIPKEIQTKVEVKRWEIKDLWMRLRKEAQKSNICPNCGKHVPMNRIYCSTNCGTAFLNKYDYSRNSPVLREYKKQLKEEYDRVRPRHDRKHVDYPIARKTYKCWFCGLDITPGVKYFKHTVVPGDEWFDEYPYQTTRYHTTCIDFATYCVDLGIFGDDGIEEDEVEALLYALAFEWRFSIREVKQTIRHGSGQRMVQEIVIDDYGGYLSVNRLYDDIEPDPDAFYVYLVSYNDKYAAGARRKELFKLQHSLDDPTPYFVGYFSEIRGYEPSAIKGSIHVRSMKIPAHKMEVE